MFTFTPLLGAQSSSPAIQSLLEFDGGIKALVDVGWDESFDAEQLRELERQVPTLSFILLTHATISHLGAFAHCCKHIPLFTQIPVYATTPVISLGRTLIQDLYDSTPLAGSLLPQSSLADAVYTLSTSTNHGPSSILLPAPTSEEIAGYFSLINSLKYSQIHQPIPSPSSPPLEGLTITAYCAGHTLGGTIWHIQHGSESVVYAVDWNQATENVFQGAAWLGDSGAGGAEIIEQLRKPTALICSSKGSAIIALSGGVKKRDETLLDHIRNTIKEGGNVLIPCDSSARVLELAYVLDRAWTAENQANTATPLRQARLYFASPTCESTMKYARSMLEWMDEGIVREFEAASSLQQTTTRGGRRQEIQTAPQPPFTFEYLKLLERESRLTRALARPGPKVILASHSSLDWGFSNMVLKHIAREKNSMILLTAFQTKATVSQQKMVSKGVFETLSDLLDNANNEGVYQCTNKRITLQEIRTSALSGNDLSMFQQYSARQLQRQNTSNADKSTNVESPANVVDRTTSPSSSDDDSDEDHQGKLLNTSAVLAHSKQKLVALTDEELGVNILLRKKDVHDYDVRDRKGRDRVFPFVAKRHREDEFGGAIRQEDYVRAEERDEVDGQDMRNGKVKGTEPVGQKRKWDDKDDSPSQGRRRSSTGTFKKQKVGNDVNSSISGNAVEDDSSDESDYEPSEPAIRGPSTAVFSTRDLVLNTKIVALDFSGLHDRRSLQMLIPLIRPRKLIITAGGEKETLALAEDCRKMLAGSTLNASKKTATDVLTPNDGTSVDASAYTNAFTMKVSRPFYKRLHWQKFRAVGIATMNGGLVPDVNTTEVAEDMAQKRQKVAPASEEAATPDTSASVSPREQTPPPVLGDVPEGPAIVRPVAASLHVGDLRLAELRKIMQANGHTAEFKGEGVLLVDGAIAVRKSGVGRIEVESGEVVRADVKFLDVKRKIYEGLAVVAAR